MLDKFRTGEGKNYLKNINNKLTLLLTNTLSRTKSNLLNFFLIAKKLKTSSFTLNK